MADERQEMCAAGRIAVDLTITGVRLDGSVQVAAPVATPEPPLQVIPMAEYFRELHARLMHSQHLQSFVNNVISTVTIGLVTGLLAIAHGDAANPSASWVTRLFLPAYVVGGLTLFWASLNSMYLLAASLRLVSMLHRIETHFRPAVLNSKVNAERAGRWKKPRATMPVMIYFETARGRPFLYGVNHLLPTAYLFAAAFLVYGLGGADVLSDPAAGPMFWGTLGGALFTLFFGLLAVRYSVARYTGS